MDSTSRRGLLAAVASLSVGGCLARGATESNPAGEDAGDTGVPPYPSRDRLESRSRGGDGPLPTDELSDADRAVPDRDRTRSQSRTGGRAVDRAGNVPADGAANASASGSDVGTNREAGRLRVSNVDTTVVIEEDDFRSWTLEAGSEMEITYNAVVRWGPPVDVILFTDEEFRAFRKGYRARYLGSGSVFHRINVPPSVTATVPAGTYHVVLNNTDWTGELPAVGPPAHEAIEGETAVHFELTAQ